MMDVSPQAAEHWKLNRPPTALLSEPVDNVALDIEVYQAAIILVTGRVHWSHVYHRYYFQLERLILTNGYEHCDTVAVVAESVHRIVSHHLLNERGITLMTGLYAGDWKQKHDYTADRFQQLIPINSPDTR